VHSQHLIAQKFNSTNPAAGSAVLGHACSSVVCSPVTVGSGEGRPAGLPLHGPAALEPPAAQSSSSSSTTGRQDTVKTLLWR
jgi:hypothetical protein